MRKLHLDWQGYFQADEKTVRAKVGDRAGVYKLSRLQKDGSLKPFCVGQAPSLAMRLLEHLTSLEENCVKEELKKGECQFRFAYLYTKEDLDAAEQALYKRYGPKCNTAPAPSAEEVEVNHN
ncbi:MAG TPA: hypothetical protein VJM83_05225 [Nitrospirota bacterium]|nr:hypothetical protein [Nitrospirota bacterium]